MEKFDLCVIGGGPAGYATAMRALDLGKKTILIEKDKIGGAGIYNGALSSKTMWEFSKRVSAARRSFEKREMLSAFDVSWSEVLTIVDRAIFDRKQQLSTHLKILQKEAQGGLFEHRRGIGKIISEHEVEITHPKKINESEIIYADNICIATGSTPRNIPTIPVDEKIIITSDGIHNLEDYPKSMVILGAGVIGCEFATIFSNFGKTKVFLIDKADRILPFEDDDIADMVTANLEKNGAIVHRGSSLVRMEIINGKVEYELSFESGENEVFRVEKALISIGRVPNVKDLWADNLDIGVNNRGIIENDDCRTHVPNIYAVGDASGHAALVNVGEVEGRHAAKKMFGVKTKELRYDYISTIMFLNPEVAAVGMNEKQVKATGKPFRLVKLNYSVIARAIAMRQTEGFFKIIVTDDDDMKILGFRAVGEHASSAIQTVALLMLKDQSIKIISELVHPHPSIIEGIQEAVRMLMGISTYKASAFKDQVKCYRCVDGVCTPIREY